MDVDGTDAKKVPNPNGKKGGTAHRSTIESIQPSREERIVFMGKQINFYICESIQNSFIEYLQDNQFEFLDWNAGVVNQPSSMDVFGLYLYKSNYGELVMQPGNGASMNILNSPVIEFSKTIIKTEQKRILRGRLWIATQYVDEEGNWVKKSELFVKDYQKLNRWIKKHVPYQEIRKGEYLVKEYVNDELKELQEKGFVLTM